MVETGMAAPLAILSALAEEQSALILQLQGARSAQHAGRTFWLGELEGHSVILATSRIGKVSAAITALQLIEAFGARSIVFTGVAGGVGPGVAVGDVVVASSFLQHDMDCSPLFPRYEIPLYGRAVLTPDADLTEGLLQACMAALEVPLGGRPRAAIHQGLIASGDRFVSAATEVQALCRAMADAGHAPLAVEMEGAAVAQVCHDYGVPFAAVRTISDRADDSAQVDFQTFLTQVASIYSQRIISRWLKLLLIQ